MILINNNFPCDVRQILTDPEGNSIFHRNGTILATWEEHFREISLK